MSRIILLLLLCLAVNIDAYTQDFSFGKINPEDFTNKMDSNASAIVLKEYGSAAIELGVQKSLILRSYTHKRILILKKDGFDYANFAIRLYKGDTNAEKDILSGLKGSTFNLIDGKIVEKELEKKSVLRENISEKVSEEKIAFPDIKEGSIIEIKYVVESPFLYNLRSWSFQGFIPKVYSEFETRIPDICRYNISTKGVMMLTSRKEVPYNTDMVTSVGDVLGKKTNYIMTDIPAFQKEDYMTSPSNYMGAIYFELASYSIPFGPSYNFNTSWTDVEKQLMTSSFGRELKRKNVFKTVIPEIIKPEMTDSDKALTIYNYIKAAIRWDKKASVYPDKGLEEALLKKTGNSADINFMILPICWTTFY